MSFCHEQYTWILNCISQLLLLTELLSDYAPAPELDYYDPAVLAADDDEEEQVSYEERMRNRCLLLPRLPTSAFEDSSTRFIISDTNASIELNTIQACS